MAAFKNATVVRRYAKALFLQAKAKNEVLACTQGLTELVRVMRLRPQFRGVVVHPFVAVAEKKSMVKSTLGEYATPLLERFCELLMEQHRFGQLPEIALAFQEEVDRSQNVQALSVQSALPMSASEEDALKKKMEAWLGASVRMKVAVNPELIGGVLIQTPDHELDGSLRGKLKQFKDQVSQL